MWFYLLSASRWLPNQLGQRPPPPRPRNDLKPSSYACNLTWGQIPRKGGTFYDFKKIMGALWVDDLYLSIVSIASNFI